MEIVNFTSQTHTVITVDVGATVTDHPWNKGEKVIVDAVKIEYDNGKRSEVHADAWKIKKDGKRSQTSMGHRWWTDSKDCPDFITKAVEMADQEMARRG